VRASGVPAAQPLNGSLAALPGGMGTCLWGAAKRWAMEVSWEEVRGEVSATVALFVDVN